MAAPKDIHWSAMKRILRFLSGTTTHGIMISRMQGSGVTAYCDADWGSDTGDHKSRTGFLIYVGGTLVSWLSRKQPTVARSTIEAKYRAVATAT